MFKPKTGQVVWHHYCGGTIVGIASVVSDKSSNVRVLGEINAKGEIDYERGEPRYVRYSNKVIEAPPAKRVRDWGFQVG